MRFGSISKYLQERKAMDTKGLSQQGISAITQVSTSTISEILNYKRAFGDETLQTLARALANMEGKKEVFTSLRQFSRLQKVATRTREDQLFTLAVGNTGIGKTTTIQQLYYQAPSTTFYVNIDFQMTWTVLMREIANGEMVCAV